MSRQVEDISEWADYSYRIKQELQTARDVQARFLPHHLPIVGTLDYYGECRPAGEVGGDLFDFILRRDGTLVTSIGDVSGKGVPAAILMAGVQSSLRNLAGREHDGLGPLIGELNRMVYDVSPDNLYVTLFCAEIDTAGRRLRYVSAGHESALLMRQTTGRIQRLESTGAVLGLSSRAVYQQRTLSLEPGDVLLAFTDGIPEACDIWDRSFGEAGIVRVARQYPEASANRLVVSLLEAACEFTGRAAPADDRTAIAIRAIRGVTKEYLEDATADLAPLAALGKTA